MAVVLFVLAAGNRAFFERLLAAWPPSAPNLPFLLSVGIVAGSLLVLLLLPFSNRLTLRPVLAAFLVLASFTAYFMDTWGAVLDDTMIENVLRTDPAEARDLVTLSLVAYVLLLGLLPAALVLLVRLPRRGLRREAISRVALAGLALAGLVVPPVLMSGEWASFLREHKVIRSWANPTFPLWSAGACLASHFRTAHRPFRQIGLDARADHGGRRRLVVFVVGEAARADRFSLNGYPRETNPRLAAAGVVNYPDFWSCGTSTAWSLPCMFSIYGQDAFDREKGATTGNVLDILARVGVHVLWLDNNSDSKGVAERIPEEDWRTPTVNPLCDPECRDEGMLARIDSFVTEHPEGDLLLVLHQLGNHGPAYWRRYPERFERFVPACHTNRLGDCTRQEVGNAYDNAILYTDHFLGRAIDVLRSYTDRFDTALFYVSDHGESLGENGLWLHGLPMFLAPDEQRHVPAILWLAGDWPGLDRKAIEADAVRHHSHDDVFSTLLGLLAVGTDVYDPSRDLVHPGSTSRPTGARAAALPPPVGVR